MKNKLFIKIRLLAKKELKFRYGKSVKLILLCFYWFGIEIGWGVFDVFNFIESEIRRLDGIKIAHEKAIQTSATLCPVCKKPLGSTGIYQLKKWHKECRTEGRKMERKQLKVRNA